MRFGYIILSFCLGCLFFEASGQAVFTLKGTIYKKSTPEKISGVIVTNLRTKSQSTSDNWGVFNIPALVGDTLLFKKSDYASQTYVINSSFDINIYLPPMVLLNEVTVKEQTKKQEIKETMNDYKKVGGYYTLNPSVWSAMNSPATAIYEELGTDPNRARKFQEHTQEELEHIEIFKRYNKALVKKVTGLTDDKEVQKFTDVFTPAYIDIKTWSDYEVVNYIKISFEWYKTHQEEFKARVLN